MLLNCNISHQWSWTLHCQCWLTLLLPTAAVPPDNNVMVVAAEGERPTLSCPLEFVKRFGQYYTVEWRVPVDMTIAKSRSRALQPWAHLNNYTLALTVGPLNSSLPRVFECVILSFNRRNMLQISNVPKGIVNIALACESCFPPQCQHMLVNLCKVTDTCTDTDSAQVHGIVVQMALVLRVHCCDNHCCITSTTVWMLTFPSHSVSEVASDRLS